MDPGSLLFQFVVLYPVATGAVWMVGGILFRLLDQRSSLVRPEGGWPGVTVLVPAYNEEAVVADCVAALRVLDYPDLEILILNDGSRDGTVAAARAAAEGDPRVTVVDDGVNRGKADRLNGGFHRARHDLVLCCDADTHLHPQAVKYLVARMLRSPRYAAVAGSPHVTNQAGLIPAMQVLEAAALIRLMRRTHALAGRVGTVAGVLGLFRRHAVLSVGGYCPAMATEDIELTWRLLKAGYLTGYEPEAVIGMEVPHTLRSVWAQRRRWARGQGEVLRTHGPSVLHPRHLPMWPILFESVLSYVWVLTLVGTTLHGLVSWLVLHTDSEVRWMLGWGIGIAVMCALQITVAAVIDRRSEPSLPTAYLLTPLYPVAYRLVNALAAFRHQTAGLVRGPRGKRVTWDLPHDGAPGTAGVPAASHGQGRVS
ncbi:glycosyltransferase [Streptomyces sp. NPDC002734]|uniref:glycosyltransferase n=1 Tax=Streptomyces sp. NPDC002734 TaxID=3154426 RepID=UPI00332D2B63